MKRNVLKKISSLALSLMLTTGAGTAAVMSASVMPQASFPLMRKPTKITNMKYLMTEPLKSANTTVQKPR